MSNTLTTKQNDKLRYIYLGRVKNRDLYTVLETDLSPEMILMRIERNILSEDSFVADATNWGGMDELQRTCKLRNIQPKTPIDLTKPLTFYGSDYDHGVEDKWRISVDQIITVA